MLVDMTQQHDGGDLELVRARVSGNCLELRLVDGSEFDVRVDDDQSGAGARFIEFFLLSDDAIASAWFKANESRLVDLYDVACEALS